MPASVKEIAALICEFLSSSTNKINQEYADSLNVAIDCISEAFEFDRNDMKNIVTKNFGEEDLMTLVNKSLETSPKKPNIHEDVMDINHSEKSETLKLEGNKAMAAKDFETAIKKYTLAIEVSPKNAVLYSNRAAAYSSLGKFEEAITNANSAVKIDPSYSKGYSRLGFSKYALGKYEEALEAYSKVLELEGSNATEAMKRDYETAKKKVGNSINLEKYNPTEEENINSSTDEKAGGFPDLSNMMGGGLENLSGLLNNPQVMQAAKKMMQNPSAMQQMMSNPAIKKMAEKFSSGNGTPNFGDMMNDPSIKDMASKFFGSQ